MDYHYFCNKKCKNKWITKLLKTGRMDNKRKKKKKEKKKEVVKFEKN